MKMTGQPLIFTSMGMFIIDDIHFPPSSPILYQKDVIGGGGTYATLGSRIITTVKKSKEVGFIVDKGSDFPDIVEKYLQSWQTSMIWREDLSRLTTKGWNLYGERDFRDFKYLTPKKRIVVEDLMQNKTLLESQSFHLICSPERCSEIIKTLNDARSSEKMDQDEIIVWEPVPDLCIPENLESCLNTLKYLNVLTPNAEEAARFFGEDEPSSTSELESLAQRFIKYLTQDSRFNTGSAIVLRCGAIGSYTLTSKGYSRWFPAFQNSLNPHPKVIDPTGGGNTFIGSFATAFIMSDGDWDVASLAGNIGAGIAIEQIGMPILENDDDWNSVNIKNRIENYISWNGLELALKYKVLKALNL